MASWTTNFRYSLKYTASMNGESVSRTISGFNTGSPSADTGPDFNPAVLNFVARLNDFTQGSLSNIRWATERLVNL